MKTDTNSTLRIYNAWRLLKLISFLTDKTLVFASVAERIRSQDLSSTLTYGVLHQHPSLSELLQGILIINLTKKLCFHL